MIFDPSHDDRKVRQFSLATSFLDGFKGRQPAWGPVGYFTYKRTYAKTIDEAGTTEEFWQTCRRVVEGIYNVQKIHCRRLGLPWSEPKAQRSSQEMFQRMWDFKFTPPGRGLAQMGNDFMFEKGGACLNNCFGPETKAWFRKKDFRSLRLGTLGELAEFSQGRGDIYILSGDGQTRRATARSFGVQKLVKVSFAPKGIRSNYRMEYDVTPDHRWILSDGTETTALKVGDKVQVEPTCLFGSDDPEVEGFTHGLIFGDGARHTYYPERHQIRLCGEKEQVHLERLEKSPHHFNTTYPKSYNGDAMVWFKLGIGMNWKALPHENSSFAYQRAFIQGWLAADAHSKPAGTTGTICLSTQNAEAAQWLIERAPLMGYCIIGFSYDPVMVTNYGPRSAPLIRITLTDETTEYIVKSITDEGREEEVFCITEPETGTFTLEGGLVTGNCGFISSENIEDDFADPFIFLMDMSMLGVGVGGDTRGAGKVKLQTPKVMEGSWGVPDSREGWVALVKGCLNPFVGKGLFPGHIDFTEIRKAGEPIKGFGGTASGPGPLAKLVKNIARTLVPRGVTPVFEEAFNDETGEITHLYTRFEGEGEPRRIESDDITDVFNVIGACVVAGGVRRSAEILFGQPDDKVFRNLKDDSELRLLDARMARLVAEAGETPTEDQKVQIATLGAEIDAHPLRSHRWASNNSIFGTVGMDYAEIGDSIARNGEPGILWLKNAQDYGRMIDPRDFKDRRARGANPCFAGDTQIATADGRGAVSIRQLVAEGNDVPVYSMDPKSGMVEIKMARNPRLTRESSPLVEIELDDGSTFRVTPDHKMILLDGRCEAKDLQSGDSLPRFQKRWELVKKGGNRYVRTCCNTRDQRKDKVFEHRLIAKFHDPEKWVSIYDAAKQSGWVKGGLIVHHKDYDPMNNAPPNLEIMTFRDHMKLHGEVDNRGEKNPMWGQEHTKESKGKIGAKTRERCADPVFLVKLSASHSEAERLEASQRMSEQRRKELFDYYKEQEAKTDLDTVWMADRLHAVRECETCGNEFIVPWRIRGQSYCGRSCMNRAESHIEARKAGQAVAFADKQRQTLHQQVKVFKDLVEGVGCTPLKKEWECACREQGVPFRIRKEGMTSNPYALTSYNYLQKVSADYNHRVKSVRHIDAEEPVYNLSVDDHHTVCLVTNGDGKAQCSGVVTFQCSEQTLESYEMCCVSADTRITTRRGAPRIRNVVGQQVDVWNGRRWSTVTPFVAAQGKKLYRVHLSDGSFLDCTDDHKWEVLPPGKRKFRQVETQDLVLGSISADFNITLPCEGDKVEFAYEWGFFTGDGYVDHNQQQVMASLHGSDRNLEGILRGKVYKEQHPDEYAEPFARINFTRSFREDHPEDFMSRAVALNDKHCGLPDWIFSMDRESTLRFVAGWIESDGNVCKQVNTDNYRVFGTEKKMRDLQMVLRRVGVNHASVYLMSEAGEELVINGRGVIRNHDLWVCLVPSYECDEISRYCHNKVAVRFGSRYGTNNAHPQGAPIDRSRKQKIVGIEDLLGEHTTFCFTEPERHMGVFGNVLTYQCLVETYPAHHDSYEDFQRTLKFAYLYAKSVTLVPTHNQRTNAVMNRNRRIGCSMSGIRQAITKLGRRGFLDWCNEGYQYIQKLDGIYADWLGIPRSIKTTSIKPSGCRPWYALTSTNQGLLTLEDLFEHHPADQKWAKQPDQDLEALGTGIISKTFNNGVAPVLRITMSYGIEVESTPNHQWWVKQRYDRKKSQKYQDVDEWRRADEIQPGDILDIKPGVYNMDGGVDLASLNSLALNMRGDATEIRQPKRMNPCLAWLLGYLWGEGAMSPSKYRLRWVDARRENLEKAQVILKNQFGLDAKIKQASEHRKAGTLEVGSKHLWHWLIRNDVFKLYADKIDIIPKVVRASGHEEIISFLAGLLDADGCTSRAAEDSVLIWTMADPDFARHVQDVALAVGIVVGRSHVTGGSSFQERRSMFHLTASGHTSSHALAMLRRHSTKVAGHEARPDFVGWRGGVAGRDGQGLILGKVIKVEPVGEMSTFDVEVAGTPWYYAGAIRSHNTVSLLCGATPGIHPPHSPFYIRNIRVHAASPLLPAARDAGYKVEPDAYADRTYVISFPVKTENCTEGKRDLSIWDQVALASDIQRYWADNQVSVTVTFRQDEAKDIPKVLEVFEDRLKSISFLPLGDDHGYVQAPYIEITETEYDAMVASVDPMDFNGSVHEQDDVFCTTDSCEIRSFANTVATA